MFKHKIVVVDDEMKRGDRQNVYEHIFAEAFDVVAYLSTPDEINEIGKYNVHAFILDVYYSNECSGIDIIQIIKSINKVRPTPIVLVSNKWVDDKGHSISILNELREFNNIICFFGWDEFKFNKKDSTVPYNIINKIKYELNKYYEETNIKLNPNDTFRILHLSDIQFGDPHVEPSSSFLRWDLPTYLKNIDLLPDIVAVSGDIAYSGKKTEFDDAFNWITDFCKKLWRDGNSLQERVLLVPGNHDMDLNFCAPDQFKYLWNSTKKAFEVKEEKNISIIKSEYQKFGFYNFCNFAEKLTHSNVWTDNYDNLFWVNNRFLPLGIRFININTASEITPYNPKKTEIKKETYYKLRDEITPSLYGDRVFNIMMGHAGFSAFGYLNDDDDKMQDNWDLMKSFIDSVGINMYLFGHGHICRYGVLGQRSEDESYSKHMIYSMASTLILGSSSRPNTGKRGFTVIDLIRNGGIVKEVKLHPFGFEGNKPKKAWNKDEDRIFNYIHYDDGSEEKKS